MSAQTQPARHDCPECEGTGVVNENGAPYVWGRADSYECANCDGTGDRFGRSERS
jgi:DnaJ-class molecular chaperone